MVKQNADSDAIIAIVANKNDLYDSQQVKDEEAREFARSVKAIFQSTSAKSDSGITSLFDNVGQKYFNPDYDCSAQDQKEQEEYLRKKNEERQKKNEPKGMKITSETSKKEKKKKFC